MIVLGNPSFTTGMRLAGVQNCHLVKNREAGLALLEKIDKKEFIIANVSILEMLPELKEYDNVASMPDTVDNFSSTDDLQEVIKSAVGIEINM